MQIIFHQLEKPKAPTHLRTLPPPFSVCTLHFPNLRAFRCGISLLPPHKPRGASFPAWHNDLYE